MLVQPLKPLHLKQQHKLAYMFACVFVHKRKLLPSCTGLDIQHSSNSSAYCRTAGSEFGEVQAFTSPRLFHECTQKSEGSSIDFFFLQAGLKKKFILAQMYSMSCSFNFLQQSLITLKGWNTSKDWIHSGSNCIHPVHYALIWHASISQPITPLIK